MPDNSTSDATPAAVQAERERLADLVIAHLAGAFAGGWDKADRADDIGDDGGLTLGEAVERLAATPTPASPPRVIITTEGGVVQAAFSSLGDLRLAVIDWDEGDEHGRDSAEAVQQKADFERATDDMLEVALRDVNDLGGA